MLSSRLIFLGLGAVKHNENKTTVEIAREQQEYRKALARNSPKPYAGVVLAALESSETDDGRDSAASPLSIYARKVQFLKRTTSIAYADDDMWFVTVAPGWARKPVRKFTTELIRKLKRKFQRYMLRKAFIGRHVSLWVADFTFFKVASGPGKTPRYYIQVHFHGLMHKKDNYLLEALSKTRGFRNGVHGDCPIMRKTISNRAGLADYFMKWCWQLKPTWYSEKTGNWIMGKGINPPRFALLKLLAALAPMKPSELEIRLGEKKATMTRDPYADHVPTVPSKKSNTALPTKRRRRRLFFPAYQANSGRSRSLDHLADDYWW